MILPIFFSGFREINSLTVLNVLSITFVSFTFFVLWAFNTAAHHGDYPSERKKNADKWAIIFFACTVTAFLFGFPAVFLQAIFFGWVLYKIVRDQFISALSKDE